MNCKQVEYLLQEYIDGDLPAAEFKAVAVHHHSCPACMAAYKHALQTRTLLRDMPVPPHSEDFVDRVLDTARKNSSRNKSTLYAAFSGAIAAGFAVWFIVASTIFSTSPGPTSIDEVYTVAVGNEVQTIKVAIQSERDLSGVAMSIQLTPNLELSGFGNRTAINWDTRLKKGTNVIKLPIVGLASGKGEIITRIQMNGKEKIMRINTNYKVPGKAWYQTNTNAKA